MLPVLYSFRRCPYAMRARLAIASSGQVVHLREIALKNKPAELLAISPNKTIPVLQLCDGIIFDESLEIMVWALTQSDPEHWLEAPLQEMLLLIDKNDFEFKPCLDKYKYSDRYPDYDKLYYRHQAEDFLIRLESRLSAQPYLFAEHATLADIAIFPFIRQFADVDKAWFKQSPYPHIREWLSKLINNTLFHSCMQKYPTWLDSGEEINFPA